MGKQSTQYVGVRYVEHETRKHNGQPDRYYTIRYKLDGKSKEESLGWASEGMTAARASDERGKLREAQRTGEGPTSLAEKRGLNADERAELERASMTVESLATRYIENQKQNIKSWEWTERWLTLHALPRLGTLRLGEVHHRHIEELKLACQAKGLSPASVVHVLQAVRGAFNFAIRHGLFQGVNPTKSVRFPKVDNRRLRFLSKAEADEYLEAIQLRSQTWHDISLVSLYAGLRVGEITSLKWKDIDLEHDIINVLDAKAGDRQAYITPKLRKMFETRAKVANSAGLVFLGMGGKRITKAGNSVKRTINALGWNDGIDDNREKATFHTLRHTFASWLAMNGETLLTIKELMGHKTIQMTMRYSHLIPDQKRKAVEQLG